MEVLGEDQRANLAALLRQGAPKAPIYAAPQGDLKKATDLGNTLREGYDKLKEKGDGSAWEGLKSKIGMGTPDLAGQNYNAEFGQYDPQFQATMAQPNTVPVDPNAQTGMFDNTMSGWFK